MKYRFVDKILNYKEMEYIEGVKAVSLEEFFLLRPAGLKDHFPATLTIEALLQLANFLIFKSFKKRLALLTMFKRIDINRALIKGEVMRMRVEIVSVIEDNVALNGYGYVEDEKILSGTGCLGALIESDRLVDPEKYEMYFQSLLDVDARNQAGPY